MNEFCIFCLDQISNTDEYAPGPYGIIARNAAIGIYILSPNLFLKTYLLQMIKKENLYILRKLN